MDYRDKYLKYKANYMAMQNRHETSTSNNENSPDESIIQKAEKGIDLKNSTDRMNYYASYKETHLQQYHDSTSTVSKEK